MLHNAFSIMSDTAKKEFMTVCMAQVQQEVLCSVFTCSFHDHDRPVAKESDSEDEEMFQRRRRRKRRPKGSESKLGVSWNAASACGVHVTSVARSLSKQWTSPCHSNGTCAAHPGQCTSHR